MDIDKVILKKFIPLWYNQQLYIFIPTATTGCDLLIIKRCDNIKKYFISFRYVRKKTVKRLLSVMFWFA